MEFISSTFIVISVSVTIVVIITIIWTWLFINFFYSFIVIMAPLALKGVK